MKINANIKGILGTAVILLAVSLIFVPDMVPQQDQSQEITDLPPLQQDQQEGNPKLEYLLFKLLEKAERDGIPAARDFAILREIDMEADDIRVVLEADYQGLEDQAHTAAGMVSRQVESLGGRVETTHNHKVQCMVPLSSLMNYVLLPTVKYVRLPIKPEIFDVTSEGVAATGADRWHALPDYRSTQSAKICILDAGFKDYEALLGTDLPASVTTRSFRADGDIYASKHGTACAEIVHDMAPDAQLWLVNFQTQVEMGNAIDWIIDQGVQIISFSMGSYLGGAGDGTGPYCELVKKAADAGLTYVTSAGNGASDHWRGTFNDPDNDGWHNFSGGDEILNFNVAAYYLVSAQMKWNDWGTWDGNKYSGSNQDFDLYLYIRSGSSWMNVTRSSNSQTGSQWPIEYIGGWYSRTTRDWGIAIKKRNANKRVIFDVWIPTHSGNLQYRSMSRSLSTPADSPRGITVAAVHWQTDVLESYSSQGPTADNRVKPDIAAPSVVSCNAYGSQGFNGTSAACPHVAGAFGLLMGKTPYTLDQIKAILEGRVLELGPSGKDNQFGKGRLKLTP